MHWFRHVSIASGLWFVTVVSAVAGPGQAQLPQGSSGFVVASIKPTRNTDGRSLFQAIPGRLAITNLALHRLILIAYGLQDDQLAGDPSWTDSTHYDVEAKADGNPSVQQMEGPMLQSLLDERFGLAAHREMRQLPVYKLLVAKRGSQLPRSKEGGCIPYSTDSPPPMAVSTGLQPKYCVLHAAIDGVNRRLDGKGVTMAAPAQTLSRNYTASLGRNVIDATELTGTFDIHPQWAMDVSTAVPADDGDSTSSDGQGPSIFTALQEQLGLRLEPAKGPVEVLVVDHIEKPSEN